MNWLTNFVRPKIQRLRQTPANEVPDNLWHQCPKCSEMIFHRELEKNLRICTHCSHHMRMPVRDRLRMLFDEGQWSEVELPQAAIDPLKFKDRKKYADRLKEAQAKTGLKDAVVVGHGAMGGMGVVVAAFEFDFMGGSMGAAVGEAIIAAADLAMLQEAPLIIVPSSGGARMQEGILSLMQMARTTVAVDKVREKGLPYITVLTDPTTGGVTASFAMLGDVWPLPSPARSSASPVPRPELRAKLIQLIGLLLQTNVEGVVNLAPVQRRKARERQSSSLMPPAIRPCPTCTTIQMAARPRLSVFFRHPRA